MRFFEGEEVLVLFVLFYVLGYDSDALFVIVFVSFDLQLLEIECLIVDSPLDGGSHRPDVFTYKLFVRGTLELFQYVPD